MPTMTIGQAFAWLAEQDPDAVALRADGEVLTRAELEVATNRIAHAWVDHGLGLDDVVTVALPNGVDFVLACVAAWKAGASVMPLSPYLSAREREAVLALADPALLVDTPGGRAEGYDESPLPPQAASSWHAPTASDGAGRPTVTCSTDPARVDPGAAFAAFVPHRAVQLVSGPLVRPGPFGCALGGLMTGHELVVTTRFDAALWLRLVVEHGVTWSALESTAMAQVIELPEHRTADVGSLQSVLHLGSRCPEPLRQEWVDWLGAERVVELEDRLP